MNRHSEKAIAADIMSTSGVFTGKAEASVINSNSLTDPFMFGKQKEYVPVTKEIEIHGNKVSYSFPAHSFTQIKIEVKGAKAK